MSLKYFVGEGFKKSLPQSFSFSINGVVELPNLQIISSPRHTTEPFDIAQVQVTAKLGGTATYTFVVKSYNSSGGDEVTHVNDTVTLGTKTILSLDILDEEVGEDRTLELSVQSSAGTFAEDITLTIGE
jgi:hypothetical protein